MNTLTTSSTKGTNTAKGIVMPKHFIILTWDRTGSCGFAIIQYANGAILAQDWGYAFEELPDFSKSIIPVFDFTGA